MIAPFHPIVNTHKCVKKCSLLRTRARGSEEEIIPYNRRPPIIESTEGHLTFTMSTAVTKSLPKPFPLVTSR